MADMESKQVAIQPAVVRRGGNEIAGPVQKLMDELMHLQVLVETLPGPRLHQDHDFRGSMEALARLKGWLAELIWVPYWGDVPDTGEGLLLLGGRDPWIETLDLRVWSVLGRLAHMAGCRLVAKGSVSPVAGELAEIRNVLPPIAAAHGWVFAGGERDGAHGVVQ